MFGGRLVRVSCVFLALFAVAFGGCQSIDRWLMGEPQSVSQWHSARELFERQRYPEAAAAFRAWLANYHDKEDVLRPFVLYKLGECHRLTRNYDEAVKVYTKTVALYSKSPHTQVRDLVDLAKLRLGDVTPMTKHGPAAPGGKGQGG